MVKNNWVRLSLAVLLVIIWFGIGSVGGMTFGKISDVTTNDQAAFLPSSADSTQVQQLQRKYESANVIPAVVIIESNKAYVPADLTSFKSLSQKLAAVEGVQQPVVGPIPSKDSKAVEFIALISVEGESKEVVNDLRTIAADNTPTNAVAYVTGPAGLSADLIKAFGGIDGILLVVALAAVFIILLAVYRSVLLPVLVLINAMFALCAAIFVVYLLAKQGIIELNGQSQGILSILVIGAATDYSLLLVARYREALAGAVSKWHALAAGVKGSFEPIVASAVTVILALLCLLFSDLNSNKSLGPIAATGIVFSLLATLSFLPALLAVFGRAAFWPSRITAEPRRKPAKIVTGREELTGFWMRVGTLLSTHNRATWIVTCIVLGLSSLGLLQLKASGVTQTDLILAQSNAVDGQKAIARHFDAGSSAPVLVAVSQNSVEEAARVIKSDAEFSSVVAYGDNGRPTAINRAKVIDNKVLLSTNLKVDPYSDQANEAVKSLRTKLSAEVGNDALVGGTTALAVDTNTTAIRDLYKIVPLVLLMIFIVLAILLRSLVAPLILILTVVLSFAATLGISALVFNHLFNFPGADASVPLFGFVFLVALGVDYNIFLVTRTREEALKYGTKAAILHSLGKTGGVITSAGIVLAATFAALGIIPILFLAQLAFIVAFGVLLDTLIVRSLLVPALFNELGSKVWWPSKKPSK